MNYKVVGHLLCVGGYTFTKNQDRGDVRYWYCSQRRRGTKCRATAKTINGVLEYAAEIGDHNHAPTPQATEIAMAKSELKRKARESSSKPAQIIQETHASVGIVLSQSLPSKEALRATIKRARKTLPSLEGTDASNLVIPEKFQHTLQDQRTFLLAEEEVEDERIVIFCTEQSLHRLAVAEFWICDGTFKTVPTAYKQLYTVHAKLGSGVNAGILPMAFALMTSKSKRCYVRLFQVLKEKAPMALNLKEVLTDFEQAQISAVEEVFIGVQQRCCFFHLTQSFWRHVQEYRLAEKYMEDSNYALKLRMIPALAFLPEDEIANAFEELKELYSNDEEGLLKYFEATYVVARARNRRGLPLFPPDIWTVDGRYCPRTTNNVESWHRRWETLVGAAHVGILKMLEELQKEQHAVDCKAEAILSGRFVSKANRLREQREKALHTVLSQKDSISLFEFLRGVAHNFTL